MATYINDRFYLIPDGSVQMEKSRELDDGPAMMEDWRRTWSAPRVGTGWKIIIDRPDCLVMIWDYEGDPDVIFEIINIKKEE